jgi:hypothetical protein
MELLDRQVTACQIQQMGQMLKVTHLCISTAVVYMQKMAKEHLNSVTYGSSVLCGEADPYKVDCNNCAKLEEQVETILDELRSAQLLIKFLI